MTSQFQVLNKILQTKDYSFITLNNLTAAHFFNYKAEYEFIKTHYETYHTVPDRLTFLNSFPDFTIQDVNEPNNYLVEQLYNDYNQSYLASRFNTMRKLLEADDLQGATRYFLDSVENLHVGSALQCTDIMSDTSRYERYLDAGTNQTQYFISTGFTELDKIITGIDRRNENMVIAARTGVGKSMMLCAVAAAASKQGLCVGIYSGEMSVDKVAYRIDTLLGKIDNSKISRGDLYYKDHYKNYLESLKCSNYGPIKVITPNDIAGPATVDALQAFVEKEHLDILFIDQYSLLEDTGRARAEHEKVANISKAIKNLQVRKQIPIISVTQMNRTKNEDKSQDTTQIALSDRIGQDATVILMLDKQDTEDVNYKGYYKFTINIVKSRDGGDGRKLDYLWDFNSGIYRYISNDNDGVTSEEDIEELENSYNIPDYPAGEDSPF
jgi:KaiC/GvpD/RAD55 family RecA-like ATPase